MPAAYERYPGDGRARDGRAGPGPVGPGPVGPHRLHHLQRAAGNAAVAVLVQRQTPPTGGGPLTAAQVAAAIRFYGQRPALYTPAVVQDLRARLHLDPVGGVDAVLVQAVARYQRDEIRTDPPVPVDGIAGANTTPRLIPQGLAVAGEGPRFAREAQQEVVDRWTALGTAPARVDALVGAVNRRLAAAGVPPLRDGLYRGNSPHEGAVFAQPTWTVHVNARRLEPAGLARADAARLVAAAFHEARHAEQAFRVARLRAGRGHPAAVVAAELNIPREIAEAAAGRPIRPGTIDALTASAWDTDLSVAGGRRIDPIYARLRAADWASVEARCRQDRAPSPAHEAHLHTAERRRDRAAEGYRLIPHEHDAFAVDATARAAVIRGTPQAAPALPEPDDDACETLRRAGRPVRP